MTTYGFYLTEYGGSLTETEFIRIEKKATAYINKLTFGRIDNTLSPTDKAKVDMAVCSVTDLLAEYELTGGKTVKSVSNDGYSETYADTDRNIELRQLAMIYLPAELTECGVE